jgi:hypothetical protein
LSTLDDYSISANIRERVLVHKVEEVVLDDHEDHSLNENECLREIQEIRARDKDGTSFQSYIRNLDPHFVLLRHLQDDIRPGSQREKDYRWVLDVSLYLSPSLYHYAW